MIIFYSLKLKQEILVEMQQKYFGTFFKTQDALIFVTQPQVTVAEHYLEHAQKIIMPTVNFPLSSKDFADFRSVKCGHTILTPDKTVLIAGPCSVENVEQMEKTAAFLQTKKVRFLRGGCFKPRTSPYSYQGMQEEGLKILADLRDRYGFTIITEAKDASHIDMILDYADIIQVGSKAMFDTGILHKCSKAKKTVLLKRHFGATLEEFLQMAEYILSGGNENVILCERGIRTFTHETRYTLDLCGIEWLKHNCNLPVFADPSHAMGLSYGIPALAKACLALGIQGIMLEIHPQPALALSDSKQQLDFSSFAELQAQLQVLANCLETELV